MIETQFQTKIKKVRCDNALELGSSLELKSFFLKKELFINSLCSYSPTEWCCRKETQAFVRDITSTVVSV